MSNKPPNTRMQRTRSSPSALRSPLMRWPLGGWGSIAIAFGLAGLMLCSVGCETINDKNYWVFARPSTLANSTCQQADAETEWTVQAEVRDRDFYVLPGVKVEFSQAGAGPFAEGVTDAKGTVRVRLAPGEWRVDATLGAFKPALYMLELGPNQTCTVKLFMALDSAAFKVS